MGEGFTPAFDDPEPEEVEVERGPEGDINNCALANLDTEDHCQMCLGICPDRERLTGLGRFFAKKAHEQLDEHVRPEIQALAKRGNVTPAEVAELHINSWEWEHITPAMNDEALVARVEHALKNCGQHKRPFSTYNEAVEGLYAPELLKRFKLAQAYADGLDANREALGQKETHYLVMADDVAVLVKALEWYAAKTTVSMGVSISDRAKVALAMIRGRADYTACESCGKKIVVLSSESDETPATFCGACGGGRVSVLFEELMP